MSFRTRETISVKLFCTCTDPPVGTSQYEERCEKRQCRTELRTAQVSFAVSFSLRKHIQTDPNCHQEALTPTCSPMNAIDPITAKIKIVWRMSSPCSKATKRSTDLVGPGLLPTPWKHTYGRLRHARLCNRKNTPWWYCDALCVSLALVFVLVHLPAGEYAKGYRALRGNNADANALLQLWDRCYAQNREPRISAGLLVPMTQWQAATLIELKSWYVMIR